MKITIQNLNRENERVRLPVPSYTAEPTGSSDYTGIWITGLYCAPRTGRRFVKTYSIWDRGDGIIKGTIVREVDEDAWLALCRKIGIDPGMETSQRANQIADDWNSTHETT